MARHKPQMKVDSGWYKSFYDNEWASATLNHEPIHKLARKQVRFLTRALGFKKNQSILDVPCGTGRHSILVAKKAAAVTGLDISKSCLALAGKNAQKMKLKNVKFLRADMADLGKFQERYDIVLNLFTSFGYFPTDKENFGVLKNLVSCLKPGGKICIEILNGNSLLSNQSAFQREKWHERATNFRLERCELDEKTKFIRTEWVLIFKNKRRILRQRFQLRIYSRKELTTMLKKCGISKIKVYPGCADGKFNDKSSYRMCLIGEKR